MEKKSHFVQKYDCTYVQLKRSTSLSWNKKALLTHIISFQETIDKKTGKHLVCFQSNGTISEELGIPFSTLEKLITHMNKTYPQFFKAEPNSTRTKKGGYHNKTIKTVNIPALLQYLEAERAANANHQEKPVEEPAVQEKAVVAPVIEPSTLPVSNKLKDKMEQDDAFDKLVNIWHESGNLNLEASDKEVENQIRVAVMNTNSVMEDVKPILNEWVTDFIKIDLPTLRECFAQQAA